MTDFGSAKANMEHYNQVTLVYSVLSGQFQMYDFGSAKANMEHYNQVTLE